jgi:hypothetical protein
LFLFPCVLFADPGGEITSISPTRFFLNSFEQFMTINGTGLLSEGDYTSLIIFTGHGPQIEVQPSAASNTQLIAFVPIEILQSLGNYHVHVRVFDDKGHSHDLGAKAFDVVLAPPPPPLPPFIDVPEALLAEATGPNGAVVTYNVTATSHITNGPVPVTCTPASGGLFPLGNTNVHCTATDANGTATADFPVLVVDTTRPEITVPKDFTTTNPVVTYTATATDIVDGAITPVCDPPSGSTFPVGTTEVVCTATDSSLNVNVASFFVTVLADTTPAKVEKSTASPSNLWPPNHEMTAVTITVVATDDIDPNPVSQIVSVSSNQPENGTGDGDAAPDWEITGALTLNLRSERAQGHDRVYTITVVTSDATGNTTMSTVVVTVSQPNQLESVVATPAPAKRRAAGGH